MRDTTGTPHMDESDVPVGGPQRVPRQIKGQGDQDVHTPWRKLYCYTQRAGTTAKIKRETRRRERREGKADLR